MIINTTYLTTDREKCQHFVKKFITLGFHTKYVEGRTIFFGEKEKDTLTKFCKGVLKSGVCDAVGHINTHGTRLRQTATNAAAVTDDIDAVG